MEFEQRGTKRDKDYDLRPEYDFSRLKGKTRGKYARRFAEGTNLVLLDVDVAASFPDAASVNETLRLAVKMARIPKG